MKSRIRDSRWLFAGLAGAVLLTGGARLRAQHTEAQATPAEENAGQSVAGAMGRHDHHHGAMALHMKWTTPRSETPEDRARAERLLAVLRASIEKYKDYRVALDEGYKPFHPELPLEEYHFTNYARAFWAAFQFDPAKPTSLLYKRTADGWEITGAMYTAPRRYAEDQLDERVPLSVVRWHAHVNLCLPKEHPALADWTRFGFAGSIATQEACEAAGGRFVPQMFGWMVHVYPYETDADKIWAK
jgi:hypothetical protein